MQIRPGAVPGLIVRVVETIDVGVPVQMVHWRN
jgi:hypothetical protein